MKVYVVNIVHNLKGLELLITVSISSTLFIRVLIVLQLIVSNITYIWISLFAIKVGKTNEHRNNNVQ